ncbi:hypothetical protein [Halobacillus sp. Marseille-P3879]|uniref:hypothetical protein n=1 Tax=Halobacillus sp. Marseille-P3879 TaxID=2045014 RepID=UPI000C7BBDA8|nr:hypothetical protein [Halobacillus sp. Marseille-P3879]
MGIPKREKALNSQSVIVQVPIQKCCDWQGFTYTKEGWHYLCETMKQVEDNPNLKYKDSILARFYTNYQPTSLMECLLEQEDGKNSSSTEQWEPLPWRVSINIPEGNNQHFGPNHERFGERQLQRIISVYKAVKQKGYHPAKYKDGYVRGYFLKKPGDYRFLITAGQHRMAALAVLGYKDVIVRLQPRQKRVITMKEVEKWPQVINGTYDKETARRIFQSYFKNNGSEKAEALGLLHRKAKN